VGLKGPILKLDSDMTPALSAGEQAVLYRSTTSVSEACRKATASIHGAFARELAMQLSVYFRSGVSVKYAGVEECTFAQFISARKPYSCASSVKASPKASPVDSHLILDLEPPLLFAFVEVMLGGKPAARDVPDRLPTEIEKQLLGLILTSMTAQLERAWSTVAGLALQFGTIESDSHLTRILSLSGAVVAARFDVSAGEQIGSFSVLMPTALAEALIDSVQPGAAEDTKISEATRVSQTVMDASVRLDVWLEGVSLQLRDLVQLREGYVIKFDYPTERNLQSTLNGAAGFAGQVVSTGRKRAFLIQS
jgi:flagellar motor switch protein FliM